MTSITYTAFQSAAVHARPECPLRLVGPEGKIEPEGRYPLLGAVMRYLAGMPQGIARDSAVSRLDCGKARHGSIWEVFAHAIARDFGDAAARFVVGTLRPASAEMALTAGAVRLAAFHLAQHAEGLRGYTVRIGDRPRARPPRKFAVRPPALARRRGDAGIRLNGKVRHNGSRDGHLIMCRHLAAAWELAFLTHDGKVPYEGLRSEEGIRQAVPPGLQEVIHARQFHSPQCLRLVRHADWGAELVRHFIDMTERGESLRTIYVMSNGYGALHAMVLGLKIRADARLPERRGYVVNLYDPNLTATHVRAACADSPQALTMLTAEHFWQPLPTSPGGYYDVPVSWFSCPAASHWTEPQRFPDDFLEPLGMWAALRMNHAQLIVECRERFRSLATGTQAAVLLAQVDGTAGLFWALQNGHAEAIQAWGGLLAASRLGSAARAELLEGRHADGDPGVRFADPAALAAWHAAIDAAGLAPADRDKLRGLRKG